MSVWFECWRRWRLPRVAVEGNDVGDFEIEFVIRDRHRVFVGRVAATIPPAEARIFIRGIDIEKDFKRQGYGTAVILALAKKYGRAVSPVGERHDGKYFWPKMREFSGRSFVVTDVVDSDDVRASVKKVET